MLKKIMKLSIVPVLAIIAFSSFTDEGESGGSKWVCTTAAKPADNNGHCAPRADGQGDSCVTTGTGPACNGDAIGH